MESMAESVVALANRFGEMPRKLVSYLQWKHGAGCAYRRSLFVMMRMCCWLNTMKKQQRFIMPKRALFSTHIYK